MVFSFLKSRRPRDFFPNKTLTCISVAIPVELFYSGIPVVRTDSRAVGVRSRDYKIFSDG